MAEKFYFQESEKYFKRGGYNPQAAKEKKELSKVAQAQYAQMQLNTQGAYSTCAISCVNAALPSHTHPMTNVGKSYLSPGQIVNAANSSPSGLVYFCDGSSDGFVLASNTQMRYGVQTFNPGKLNVKIRQY